MKLTADHWVVIAAFLGGIGMQLATAQHGWMDVATPGFVAGLLMQTAAGLRAMYVKSPGNQTPDVEDVH